MWSEAAEHVLTASPVVAGSNTLNLPVPPGAAVGMTIGRFRLSSVGVAAPTGPAPDGEVEDHEVTVVDGSGPGVVGLASLGTPVADCSTVRTEMDVLEVTFDEPVVGADQVGSYLLLAAGPDGDISTSACGPVLDDDLAQLVTSADSDLDPTSPTVSLQLGESLPPGLVRLVVCEAIENLAGYPLDGDGDLIGGDPFVTTFRVDPDNLLANGDFDRCPTSLDPWASAATPPNAVLPSDSEDFDASTLSGSARIVSAVAESTSISQCVELPASLPRLDLRVAGRLDAVGAATATLELGCDVFDAPACAGSIVAAESASHPLPDLAAGWTEFFQSVPVSPTASSALCRIAVTADDPAEPELEAFLDRASLTAPLATTTAIVTHTPDPSRVGELVAVSWTVAVTAPGSGTPTGLVTVSDGVDACSAAVESGGCSLVLPTAGARTLVASYAGDAAFASSQGTAVHQVDPAATTTTIVTHTPNPSIISQPIQIDVAVSVAPPGGGTPSGEVEVVDGAGASCVATLTDGSGACTLTPTVVGTLELEATYVGDGDYLGSTISEPHLVTDGSLAHSARRRTRRRRGRRRLRQRSA